MTLQYLTRKFGMDALNVAETNMAYDYYTKVDLITPKTHSTGEFICLMQRSLSPEEYEACTIATKNSNQMRKHTSPWAAFL